MLAVVTARERIEDDFFGAVTEFGYIGLADEYTRSTVFWEMMDEVEDMISQPMFATITEEME